MTPELRPIDREAARTVLGWRYLPPYDVYNIELDGEALESAAAFLADPSNGYFRIDGADGTIEAFCCYGADAQVEGGDYTQPALDIGLGMRPDLTGHGQGAAYARLVVAFGVARYHPALLRVTIAQFNLRAQRAWQRAGFVGGPDFLSVRTARRFQIFTRAAEEE